MRRIKRKVIGSFLVACILLLGSVSSVSAAERFEQIGNVTPSNVAYSVGLKSANYISIFNKDKVDLSIGKRYYLTYTVDEVNEHEMNISGVFLAKDKSQTTPYVTGMLKYSPEKDMLLEPGASYFCRVEVTAEGWDYVFAKMGKNDSHWIQLPTQESHEKEGHQFFGIYLAGTKSLTAQLSSVLFYDEQGNNLGVEVKTVTGSSTVKKTSTAIEDYSLCEAVYWCEANQTTLILDGEQNIGVQVENLEEDTTWYKYNVRSTTLIMQKDKEEVAYEYYYSFMRDSEGNRYERLRDTKVTFETGQKEHEGNKTVDVTAKDGYKVQKPADPTVNEYTFKEWCLSNGRAFDFEKYVMESVTLYARYEDGDGHEYLVVNDELNTSSSGDIWQVVVLSASMILFTAVMILLMMKAGKKNGKDKD